MTPVTGPYITPLPYIATRSPEGLRVAHGQKDGPVISPGDLEGFIAPWIPIDGIMGVLKQIWGLFVNQAIGGLMLAILRFHGRFILSRSIYRQYTLTKPKVLNDAPEICQYLNY